MPADFDYAPAIARCLAFPHTPDTPLINLVREVLDMPDHPDRTTLEAMQRRIDKMPDASSQIALVYGGATKIKGYVFEAPKLPEIRGASALLTWVNDHELPLLWGATTPKQFVERGIIYASGGNILAFAPASQGQALATQIEQTYTEQTLTANSVAVSAPFQLLELRFGRLYPSAGNNKIYWADDFFRNCANEQERAALLSYYYPPEGVRADDLSASALSKRFFNRKTFGELVTVLATMANRRRDERASHGTPRALPHYDLLPWAVKCQSSDVRPAVITAHVGGDKRPLSDAAARKLAVGRVVKKDLRISELEHDLKPWLVPDTLADLSWERRWNEYLKYLKKKGCKSAYAQHPEALTARPASDVRQIGVASGRYIGMIYADGNNIGKLIATLKTPEIYHKVSCALSSAAQDSVFRALAAQLQPIQVDQQWVHPFEILAIGGDDLFIIVPGKRAFAVALAIGQAFEQILTQKLAELNIDLTPSQRIPSRYAGNDASANASDALLPSVGLSAGVIIAQENAPIFFLRDLVEELLKSAKKLAKDNAAAKDKKGRPKPRFFGGAVDFMVLKSITMVTDKVKGFRKAALGVDSPRRLTARPYTWHEFAGLLATVRALKTAKVPRSQLYRLRRVLELGSEPNERKPLKQDVTADSPAKHTSVNVITSVMEYLYTRSRFPNNVADTLKTHIEHAWCNDPQVVGGRPGLPPWMSVGTDAYETIWPDLLEAYEFVPEQEA